MTNKIARGRVPPYICQVCLCPCTWFVKVLLRVALRLDVVSCTWFVEVLLRVAVRLEPGAVVCGRASLQRSVPESL